MVGVSTAALIPAQKVSTWYLHGIYHGYKTPSRIKLNGFTNDCGFILIIYRRKLTGYKIIYSVNNNSTYALHVTWKLTAPCV